MLNRLFVATATAITVFIGAWLLYMGLGRAFSGAGLQEVAVLPLAAGVAMISGVLVGGRSPRVGTSMVIVGVLIPVLMFPWMIAITLPIAVISILGNLARGRAVQASV